MSLVTVNLFATLRVHAGGRSSIELDIVPGQTIEQLLQGMGITGDEARILFVNSRHARLGDPLQGGEQIAVFPPIGGG